MNPRIVSGLRAGEPGALGGLFDAVGEELFQYCWLMVRGREAALAAVRDTIIVAHAHIGRLRDPGQLRPWLYALARSECQRYTQPAAPEEAVPALNATRDEARLMAWSAVMSLPPAEREMLDLTARRGMSASDAGLVTGLGAGAASLIEQARASLQRAMGAEIAARRPDVAPGKISPAKVYARLPWPTLPPGTRANILACFTDERRARHLALAASRVPPLDSTGFPPSAERRLAPPPKPASRRLAVGLLAAAISVGVTLVLAMAGLSLPGGIWSAPAGSTASGAPDGDVAHAGPGGEGAQPMVAPSAGSTGRAHAGHGFWPSLGPGPGTGSAASLYLAIAQPQPSQGQATGGRGAGQGIQGIQGIQGGQGGQPPGSQPGPVPSSTLVFPPPPTGSPAPSGSGSQNPPGSASPPSSPSTPCTPPPSVSPPASTSPPPSPASPSPPSSSGASGSPAPS